MEPSLLRASARLSWRRSERERVQQQQPQEDNEAFPPSFARGRERSEFGLGIFRGADAAAMSRQGRGQ